MHPLLLSLLLSVISGVLTGIPLVFNALAPLAYVAMIPFFSVLIRVSKNRAGTTALCSFAFGFSYDFVAFGWISQMHPLTFTGISNAASLLICVGGSVLVSALFSVPVILFALALRFVGKTGFVRKHTFLLIPAASAFWAVSETATELGPFAVPWARLCVGQASYPALIGSAGVLGGLFVGAVAVAVNMSLALLILDKRRTAKASFAAAAASVMLLSVLLSGLRAVGTKEEGSVEIAILQGNVPTNEKWNDPSCSVETYIAMLETLDGNAPDIVFMPETAVTFDITDSPQYLSKIKAFAYRNGCAVLFGTYMFDGDGRCLNTVRLVDRDGLSGDAYAKRKLVPFAEHLPFEEFFKKNFPALTQLDLFSENIYQGDSLRVFEYGDAKIGALICFDSLFPSLSRETAHAGANLMFIATNDGWFTDTVAVSVHSSAASVRAVETGRYLVRAANTGISSVIAPDGTKREILPRNRVGIIRCEVPLVSGDNPYTAAGDVLKWICISASAVSLVIAAITHIRERKENKNGSDTI